MARDMNTNKENLRPLERWACYVVAIVQVPRILARSGQEATDLAVARVRKLLRKEDNNVFIPGVTTVRGNLSGGVLEDIKRGKIPGLTDGEEQKSRKMPELGEGDSECRNCGHEKSLHIKGMMGCGGKGGIVCGCPGFEKVIEGIDEVLNQGELNAQDRHNELRRRRYWRQKINKGDKEGRENEQRSGDADNSYDDSSGTGGMGNSEPDMAGEERASDSAEDSGRGGKAKCGEYWNELPTRHDHNWGGERNQECTKCGEKVKEYYERWSKYVKEMLERSG